MNRASTLLLLMLELVLLGRAAATTTSSCKGLIDLRARLNLSPQAPQEEVTRSLDRLIQFYAFRALMRPRTGEIYDVPMPMWIQGAATVQAARLKVASLQHRGFIFNELVIPPRLALSPPTEYIVLVYRFLAARLLSPYCPDAYDIVGPVVGVKAYTYGTTVAAPLVAMATEDPITVRIPVSATAPRAATMCAFFDGNGTFLTTAMTFVNLCSLVQLGDATLVVPSVPAPPLPPPLPQPPPRSSPPGPPPPPPPTTHATKAKAVVVLFGVLLVVVVVGGVPAACLGIKIVNRAKAARRDQAAATMITLDTAVGFLGRTPVAPSSRTRPLLEREYRFG